MGRRVKGSRQGPRDDRSVVKMAPYFPPAMHTPCSVTLQPRPAEGILLLSPGLWAACDGVGSRDVQF